MDANAITLEPGQAIAVDWSEEQYFADRSALTRSALLLLGEDPALFHHIWLAGGQSQGPSDSMRLGTNAHLAILQPQEWARRVGIPEVPRPEGAKKSAKAGTSARTKWQAWDASVRRREELMSKIDDRIDVSLSEFGQVQEISQAVWSHHDAAALLSAPGYVEQTVIWREPRHGLLMKVRLDRCTELSPAHVYGTGLEPGPAIGELKTARDVKPRPFLRAAVQHGYDVQDALYSDAVAALIGDTPSFYFIAVCNGTRKRVAVHRIATEIIESGRSRYQALIDDYVARRERDDWLAPWERGVNVLSWE